jgi:hypothetical protein
MTTRAIYQNAVPYLAPVRAKRLLGDAAYDFYARDGRDGMLYGPFDTPGARDKKILALRKNLDEWQRCVIEPRHAISEAKVLKLLRFAAFRPGGR